MQQHSGCQSWAFIMLSSHSHLELYLLTHMSTTRLQAGFRFIKDNFFFFFPQFCMSENTRMVLLRASFC